MTQPQVLVDRVTIVEWKWRGVGVGKQLELGHRKLDLAGDDVRIDVLRVPASDISGGADHVLGAQPMSGAVRVGGGVGVKYELDDARAIAQIDEDQAAVIAATVHPAGNTRMGPRALRSQLAAPGIAVVIGSGRVLHGTRLARNIVGITSVIMSSR